MGIRIRPSRLGVVFVIVGSVFLLTAGAAFAANSGAGALVRQSASAAASAGSGALATTEAISGTQPVTGAIKIAGFIATVFEVPISDVTDLRSGGYGFGELAIAYALALESGLDLEDILALRDGAGWGEIAQDLDLAPSNRDRNLGRLVSGRVTVSATTPVSGTSPTSGTISAGAQRLAGRLGADPEEVAALLEQGFNYGAVAAAYKIAGQYEGADGANPQALLDRRRDGDSWGKIKRELKASLTTTLQAGPAAQGGKPEQTGKPDHANKPDHGKPAHAGPKENHGKKPK